MENTNYHMLTRAYDGLSEFKTSVENQLVSILPKNSFSVIVRNYAGDVRSADHQKNNYRCMIMLTPEARHSALQNRENLESMGYQVSSDGRISLN